jgi:phosphatidate cytidylyltransferase
VGEEWKLGGTASAGGAGEPPPAGPSPAERGSPSRWLEEDLEEPAEPAVTDDDLLAGLTETPERRKVKVGDPEALLGPAWEDPTARTVGREPPQGPRTGRNIPLAVVSAAVLAVLAFLFVLISPWLFTILAGAVVLVAQYELYTTSQKRGYHPAIALGLVTGGLAIAAAYFKGEPAMAFMLALTTALTFLWYMASPAKARAGTLANVGVTLLGVVYLPFMASFVVLILTQANSGKGLMLSVLGLTFLYDVAAFVIGSWYGTHPLAPTISPKKSWEGLIGATFTTIVISMAFVSQVGPMTLMRAIGLALVVCVFAPLGDLAESAVKRDLGVKDMGSIMPGHGGMLDRIDSVLFVAPAAFYFLRVIF